MSIQGIGTRAGTGLATPSNAPRSAEDEAKALAREGTRASTTTTPAADVEPTPPATPRQPDVAPGPVVSQADAGRKLIALTFDDGPSSYTNAILDVLASRDVPATFFVLGEHVAANGDTLRRMRDSGHAIGNHSWDHPELTGLGDDGVRDQLARTQDAIQRETGEAPQVFRPPYGARSESVDRVAGELGLRDILWDVDTVDWSRPGAGAIRSTAVNDASDGSIVLMHDGGGDRSQTLEALPGIIDDLRAQGYEFTTVPKLLAPPT